MSVIPTSDPRVPPVIDYGTKAPRRSRRLLIWLGLGLGVLLLMSILLPSLCRSSEPANRVKCSSNLRQIGQAILLYANDHHGAYPDSFATILLTEDITSECFVCPSSNDEKSPGPTTQAAASLNTGGHLSYVYLGNGFNSATVPSTAVVAYEPMTNHDNDGMNVLFGDGHVEFVGVADGTKITAAVAKGNATVLWPSVPNAADTPVKP